jgi:hypothetical protein
MEMALAHELERATGSAEVQRALYAFVGEQSFSAGVVYGMTKSLVVGVWQLGDLLKTFALAEYNDLRHAGTFWQRVRAVAKMGTVNAMAAAELWTASLFWPRINAMAESAARQRDALFTTVAYAFEHPGEVFRKIKDDQVRKYQEFKRHVAAHTVAGNFHAGALLGELLLDILLIADGITALARLATRIPGLLELLPRLRELAPAMREAVEQSAETVKAADAAKTADAAPARPVARAATPPAAPAAAAAGPKPTILSGHGGASGDMMTVPQGTSITVYSEHGATISDRLGNAIETGGDTSGVWQKTYNPGDQMPDYILSEPTNLNIMGNPTTVTQDTRLSDLVQPNMGCVKWAACTYDPTLPSSNLMYDTHGVIDTSVPKGMNPWVTTYTNPGSLGTP